MVGEKEVVDDEGRIAVGVGVYSLPEVKVLKYGMGESEDGPRKVRTRKLRSRKSRKQIGTA